MPMLSLILLVILIAQIGFWETFGAVLGAAAVMVLFIALELAVVPVGLWVSARKLFRRQIS